MQFNAETLRGLPRDEVEKRLRQLPPSVAEHLLWSWDFWKLPHQHIEPGSWRWWILMAGRGSGKTRVLSEETIKRAQDPESCGGQMLLAGRTAADTRDVIVDGQSGILRRSPPWFRPLYEPSKMRLTWPNGVIANIRSGDKPEGFRGLQWGWAVLDEFAHWRDPERTLYEGLEPAGRLGPCPQGLITTSPTPIKVLRELVRSGRNVVRGASTYANRANLPAAFIEAMRAKYEGTRLGRQEIEGQILDDNPAALWDMETISAHRVSAAPTLTKIVVAVDPAASYSEDSDETGIVCAGVAEDRHGYVLADETCRDKPEGWARRAIELFHRFRANLLIVEDNNGGDMVEHTIRMVSPDIPIKRIRAKHGKRVRAEPVAAVYEQGRVHHVGYFEALEDQMVSVEPGGDEHDDRIDALVHALTELVVEPAPDLLSLLQAMA